MQGMTKSTMLSPFILKVNLMLKDVEEGWSLDDLLRASDPWDQWKLLMESQSLHHQWDLAQCKYVCTFPSVCNQMCKRTLLIHLV